MAKKASKSESAPKQLSLKVQLSPEEYKAVRIAAAEQEKKISKFLHDAVVAAATPSVMQYFQREVAPKGSRKSDPSDE